MFLFDQITEEDKQLLVNLSTLSNDNYEWRRQQMQSSKRFPNDHHALVFFSFDRMIILRIFRLSLLW